MLELFAAFEIHATWATVGFLFMDSMDEVRRHRPAVLPGYADARLDPFAYVDGPGSDADPALHFAPHLIERVLAAPGQELATHTLSHFYPLEAPHALDAFRADLAMAIDVARLQFGVTLTSIAFPRNQYSTDHLKIAAEAGMTAYRGSPEQWMYATRAGAEDPRAAPLARFADTYLPIAPDTTFTPTAALAGQPVNVPGVDSSGPGVAAVDVSIGAVSGADRRDAGGREARTALPSVVASAQLRPRPEQNLAALREVLEGYSTLRDTHGMRSLTMREVVATLADG